MYVLELTLLATGIIYQNASGVSGQVKFRSQISFPIFAFTERKVSFKVCGKIAKSHTLYLEKSPVCPRVRVLAFPYKKLSSRLVILKCLSGQGNAYGLEIETLFANHPGKTSVRVEVGRGLVSQNHVRIY